MKRFLFFISILLLFVSCENTNTPAATNNSEGIAYYDEAAAPKRAMSAGALMQESSNEQKIIRSANLRYEVYNMDSSKLLIENLLKEYKGAVQSERQYSQTDRLYTYLTVRIPAEKFENFINALLNGDDIRRLEEKNIAARDVTEQFIDIETRLNTKREALKRYHVLLQKAETVSDMITVEDKIRRLQEEIESQEARLEYLSGQVEMSEVRINLYEVIKTTYVPNKSDAFFPTLLRALHSGLSGIVVVFFWVIKLWPIWLGIVLIRLLTKKSKRE